MVSARKLAANRRNALKSTGPRTPEGKRISSMNALKHGLRSERVLRELESRTDLAEAFARLREELKRELLPIGSTEQLLVERIVEYAWKLRRAQVIENQASRVFGGADPQRARHCPRRQHKDLNDAVHELATLSRYQAELATGQSKLLRQLHQLQDRRRDESKNSQSNPDSDVSPEKERGYDDLKATAQGAA